VPAFDPDSLFVELVVSSVGLALLMYGKKTQRWPQLVAGLLLMTYPYVITSAGQMIGVGAMIVAGLAAAVWLGW
jgi:hypothetical protein